MFTHHAIRAARAFAFICTLPFAHAGYIVNCSQIVGDVVCTGSGSVDLTGLLFAGPSATSGAISPSSPLIFLGNGSYDAYRPIGVVLPSMGPGGVTIANTASGLLTGIEFGGGGLLVPHGYTTGALGPSSSTWTGTTLGALGLTVGSYTASWGSGIHADTFVVNVGSNPVPESSSAPLTLAGLGGIAVLMWKRRRDALRHLRAN